MEILQIEEVTSVGRGESLKAVGYPGWVGTVNPSEIAAYELLQSMQKHLNFIKDPERSREEKEVALQDLADIYRQLERLAEGCKQDFTLFAQGAFKRLREDYNYFNRAVESLSLEVFEKAVENFEAAMDVFQKQLHHDSFMPSDR
jgi:hypothetical protein